MLKPDIEPQIMEWSHKKQSGKRFAHTQRVVETVDALAEKWAPENRFALRLAGWIHDAYKQQDPQKLLSYAQKTGLEISEWERQNPMLLHGMVAYWKAHKKFTLHDDCIRTACTYHTTGSPHMKLTDKLFFLADLIEPGRDFPMVDLIREMAWVDVDKAMLLAIDGTLRYLLSKKAQIDPRVLLLYNELLQNDLN